MIEIKLIPNWDEKLACHNNSKKSKAAKHYSHSRHHEKKLLVQQLVSKTPGTILVSGHRGVGKTTLIQRVLDEVENNDSSKNRVIDIRINGPEIIEFSENKYQLERRILIRIIITKLYKKFLDLNDKEYFELKQKVDDLYNKATASTFTTTRDTFDSSEDTLKNEIVRELKLQIPSILKFIGALSLSITSLVVASSIDDEMLSNIFKAIAVVSGGIYPFKILLNMTYKSTGTSVKTKTESARVKYEHDNSFASLVDDLDTFHNLCQIKDVKIVYVIDELDKLDSFENGNSKTILNSIFNNLKNFFTLSSAAFLFVTDENEYLKHFEHNKNESRGESYTYFDMKIFISRPTWNEISSYLDDIVVDERNSNFDFFKHAICYESRRDFFDLKNEIRNLITKYDGQNPVITIDQNKFEEFKKKAFLHSAYEKVFTQKYKSIYPRNYVENEKIVKSLQTIAEKVFDSRLINNEISVVENAKMSIDEISAQSDLINVLMRHDFVSFVSNNPEIRRGTIKIPVRVVKYFNVSPNTLVNKLDIRSSMEEQYLFEYEQFDDVLSELYSMITTIFIPPKIIFLDINSIKISKELMEAYKKLFEQFGLSISQFYSQIDLYLNLKKDPPEGIEPDAFKGKFDAIIPEKNQVLSMRFNILANALHKRLDKIQSCFQYTVGDSRYSRVLANKLPGEIIEKLKVNRHIIISRADQKKTLILFSFEVADILQKQNKVISDLEDEFFFVAVSMSGAAKNCETIFFGDNCNFPNLKKLIESIDEWYH